LIFGHGDDQEIEVRQKAGLALKSQLESHFATISTDILNYCKEMIIKAYD